MRLSEVPLNQKVKITGIEDPQISLKLMEMGFITDEVVTIEYLTSSGDPIVVNIAGYLVGLRLNEAASIMVLPLEESGEID